MPRIALIQGRECNLHGLKQVRLNLQTTLAAPCSQLPVLLRMFHSTNKSHVSQIAYGMARSKTDCVVSFNTISCVDEQSPGIVGENGSG